MSEAEAEAFERHLAACEQCRSAVEELRDIVGLLPLSAEPIEPPAGMKARVLEAVLSGEQGSQTPVETGEPKQKTPAEYLPVSSGTQTTSELQANPMAATRTRRRGPRIAIAGLSAAVVLLGVYAASLQSQLSETREQLRIATAETLTDPFQLNQAVTLTPAAEQIIASGIASIVIDDRGTHLLVQAENLPELHGSEAFQVWLLEDGQPTNAGTFLSHNGTGALMFTFEPHTYDTVAITHEPDAGGTTPRGEMVLVAELGS
ncbi:anti-sigma factor [Paenibacillus sp. TRM 82003]|nr:anti-sigma factor [Paenibacillus sp. TRM 82003]